MNTNEITSSELIECESNPRVFRIKKSYRNQGILILIFFLFAGIGSAYGIWIESLPDRRLYGVLFFGLFFSFLSVGSLWMILGFKFGSLTFQNNSIIQQGVIFRKEIDLSSLYQIRWGLSQGGSITLKSLNKKISINLDNYERNERLWLIRYFQSALPEESQNHWDLFCYKIAIPVRDYNPEEIRTPGPGEILITRQRWSLIFIPLILVSTIVLIVAAWVLQTPRLLFAPIQFILLWLVFYYNIPKQGMVGRRISADTDLKQMLIFLFCWGALGLIGIIILKIIDFPEPQNTISNVCLMCIWFTILLIIVSKLDRNSHKRNLKKVKAAVEKWNPEVDPQTED
ncbi:MAG: hypothetical protein K0U86_04965 [Planctomycetes bacterium]|nr:hypothetical protein [Planctomycetota bacterium]MCH9724240.1 hypothetical protein [Planctomycetota bacterium]MCH9778951.1 hypothetical protein [Planctomycetota bacterium]MCH9791726.1 hypothetical protein [Planctomycetota bacterium]